MTELFLPACWLVPGDPGPFPIPFRRTHDDRKRFLKWFNAITSIKKPESVCKELSITYNTIIDSNKELFSINCLETNTENPLHSEIRQDVIKTIHSLKTDYNLSFSPIGDNDIIENIISRILIYAHLNGINYKKGLCELVLPIIHVYFYGILNSEKLYFDMPTVESFTADSFVKFMTNPTINHIRFLQPLNEINELQEKIMNLIKPYSIYVIVKQNNIDIGFLLNRWIPDIFVFDMDFGEVVKVWDYIFSQCPPKDFHSVLLSLCAAILILFQSKCVKMKPKKIYEILLNIHEISANSIIAQANEDQI